MPSLDIFTDNMKKLGIQKDMPIICYDNQGLFSVARAAWMFRYFGADNVRILNGGLKKWVAESNPTESGYQDKHGSGSHDGDFGYQVKDASSCILDIKEMHTLAGQLYNEDFSTQVLDARGSARFNAEVPEPRPGVRGGCIKNSMNLPFNKLVNENGTMKSNEELQEIFKGLGVDHSKPIVNTCGSGVTACVLELGLAILGTHSKVYDGSWSEYGSVDEPDFKK